MEEAERGLERLYQSVAQSGESAGAVDSGEASSLNNVAELRELADKIRELPDRFQEEMDNDFNTAAALGHLFDLSRTLNRFHDASSRARNSAEAGLLARGALEVRKCAGVLGLLQSSPSEFFREQRRLHLKALDIDENEIEQLVAERARARNEKDWARADEIRQALAGKSISLEDGPDGTTWRVKPN
jgi:cysteinyl-tRNA synthetase